MCGFPSRERTQGVRGCPGDAVPRKRDQTPRPATPVVLESGTGIDLPPRLVEPANDPHRRVAGGGASGRATRTSADIRFGKEIFPMVHEPVKTGKVASGPPPNWNAARFLWPLPLRRYGRAVAEAIKMNRFDLPPSSRPYQPYVTDVAETDDMLSSGVRAISSGSEQSAEHVYTAPGLARELLKIWPENLPGNFEDFKSGLNAAIRDYKVSSTSPSQIRRDSGHYIEQDVDRRHSRVETVGSIAQLRKSSPVKNLREHYKTGASTGLELSYHLPLHSPSSHPIPAPGFGTNLPSSSILPDQASTLYTLPQLQQAHAVPQRSDTTSGFTFTQEQQNTGHARQTPHQNMDTTSQRESKAIRYLTELDDHIQRQNKTVQAQDGIIGRLTRENNNLRATVHEKQGEIKEKDGHIAYLEGVIQNMVNENEQLKMQLQAHNIGYTIQIPAPGAQRALYEPPKHG